jgi:hypothetical protein
MPPADQIVSVSATEFVYPFGLDSIALHLVQRHVFTIDSS